MRLRPLILLLGSTTALAWSASGRQEGEDRDWDAQHLDLDVTVEPTAGTIAGTATWTLAPHTGAGAQWRVDQVGLDITGVLVDDKPVPFEVEPEALSVRMDPKTGHKVAIRYAAKPRSGLHFRGPGPLSPDRYTEVWSQGEDVDNRHWFPLPDGPEDRFTVSGTLHLPDGYTAVTIGESRRDAPGVFTFQLDKPIAGYLVALTILPANALSVVLPSNPPIAVWTGPGISESLLASGAARLPEIMAFLEEKTGTPFPFSEYREVYVQRFIYGGMENPSMTVMARGLLGEGDSHPPGNEREDISAHEMAHQWYGDMLTCRAWTDLWLNEGFASFFASEWMRHAHGPAEGARDNLGAAEAALDSGPMAGRFWSTPKGDHAMHDRVYVRGAAVLGMLRNLVGEEAFWASIRRYTRDNAWDLVETEDLRRAFEAETGLRLRWFFDQWVHLPGSPKVEVHDRYEDGSLTLRISQDPVDGHAPWVFPIDVEIGTADGPITRRVWMDEAKVTLIVDLPAPPSYVAIDPEGTLVARIVHEQSDARLLAQLDSPSPAAKMRAVRTLGEGKPAEPVVAALSALLLDPDPVWVEEAARALGDLDEARGNAALGQLLNDPARSARARIAAARALGAGTGQGEAKAALLRAWKSLRSPGDLSHESIAEAVLRAIRPFDRDLARSEARNILSKPVRAEMHTPREEAALAILAKEGGPADLKLVLRHVDGSRPPSMLHEAMRAAVRIAAASKDDAPKVARAIEPLLDSAFQRTRGAALASLAEVGDEQTLRVLEHFVDVEDTPWLRDQAKDAAAAIRARSDAPPPQEAELRARLDELDLRLDEITAEMDRLKNRH